MSAGSALYRALHQFSILYGTREHILTRNTFPERSSVVDTYLFDSTPINPLPQEVFGLWEEKPAYVLSNMRNRGHPNNVCPRYDSSTRTGK